jgi:hypothetical protein
MALAPDLAERCLSLPHELNYAKGYVSFAADQAFEPDGHLEVVAAAYDRFLRLGLEAGGLAATLRSRYRWRALPSSHRATEWMKEALAKIEADKVKADARRAEENAELFATFGTPPPHATDS